MQFPVSHPDDGFIDISIQEIVRFTQNSCPPLISYVDFIRSAGNSCWTQWRVSSSAAPIGSALYVYEQTMTMVADPV